MFVYGDVLQTECPRTKLIWLTEALRQLAGMPPGVARHGALVGALIEAGELAQGIADARFAETGERDARWPECAAAMALLARIAQAVRASWESGFARLGAGLPEPEIRALAAARLPEAVRTKRAEGFALYSLYPEGYLRAAATALGPAAGAIRAIGIRSIGAPLAAMVAAAVGAPPPVTVRPVGHPFRRRLALTEELTAELLADPAARFAVADEGPGLSGSSFGAVADFLEDHGVAVERLHFFPSHRGPPGPRASPRHRDRWARTARHMVDVGELLLHAPWRPEHRLAAWAAELIGAAPAGPLEEISTGLWRAHHYAREADWPAAKVQFERRKFLLRTAGGGDRSGTWLLKFAGLGREGMRKLERARALQGAGLIPPVAGYRHGFLVERWVAEARCLDQHPPAFARGRLVEQIGRYLGFRARHFSAGPDRGASLAMLWEMARHNTRLALGSDLAHRLHRCWAAADLDRLESRLHRVETDNRLHAWEWLVLPDGRLLKADALDHHAAHDLVGCQDIAWDIAGAVVELGLSEAERERLCVVVEREAGRTLDPRLLALLEPCYLAFQLADHAMAAAGAAGWGAEPDRLRAAAARYAAR
ncbi:MAG TPA: hypothetical protein VE684_15910, partial [Crenalkalicoccus sp.]|nr:hypothetical protein [Crenalkalicoccus sp.]